MAQQPEHDIHNKISTIDTVTETQSVGRESPESAIENTNNSAAWRHGSSLANEPNTNLSISSIDSEFISTLEDIYYEEDFAHMRTNNSADTVSISPDQATPEDDTHLSNSTITTRKTLKGIESLNILKGLMTNEGNVKIPFCYALLGTGGVLLGCLFISTLTIVPQQNVKERPEYWYEYTIQVSVGYGIILAGNCGMIQTAYWMQLDIKKYWKSFFSMVFVASGSYFLVTTLFYIIWVIVLKHNYPMPFNTPMGQIVTQCVFAMLLWYQFPKTFRVEPAFKTQFRYYVLAYMLFPLFNMLTFPAAVKWFKNVNGDYQWVIALILPLTREIQQMVLLRVVCRSAQCNNPSVRFSSMHTIGARYAFFHTMIIATMANDTTSYTIVGVDFVINLILCFRIIKRHIKNNYQVDEKQMDYVQELVLNETIECVVPIGYCVYYLMTCYGPNSGLFEDNLAISEPGKVINATAQLFLVDMCSGIISAYFLWNLCGINLFKVYLHSQRELWPIMASQQVYIMYEVSYFIIYPAELFIAEHFYM